MMPSFKERGMPLDSRLNRSKSSPQKRQCFPRRPRRQRQLRNSKQSGAARIVPRMIGIQRPRGTVRCIILTVMGMMGMMETGRADTT
eukprot:gene3319-biopygen2231